MELEELKEIDKKELDRITTISKKPGNDKKMDINIFYKDFNLNEPYTSFNPLSANDLKPFQLLPFFKNIIIDIKPFKKEKDFMKYYGMDVDELLEQHGKGIFKFRLTHNYYEYKNLENNYLDNILDKNPPVIPIINENYNLLLNGTSNIENYENYINKNLDFGSTLLGDLGGTDPLSIIAMDLMNGHQSTMDPFENDDYTKIVIQNLYKLKTCGYSEVVEFLKRFLDVGNGRLDWAFVFSNAYANFLSNPILDSLNGTHLVHSQLKHVMNDLSMRKFDEIFPKLNKRVPGINIDESMILSADIAKEMVNNINMPTLMSMEDVDNYDNKGPIKALASLEKTLLNKESDKIVDLSYALQTELISASRIVENMQSKINHDSNLIRRFSLGVGIIGSIASLISDPSNQPLFNLMAIGGNFGEILSDSRISSYFLNKLTRFNKENHVLYLYDNNEHVSLNLKNYPKSFTENYIPFNDSITEKFEYYEYLYNNIPLLQILLDINTQQITKDTIRFSSGDSEIIKFLTRWAYNIQLHNKSKLFVKQLQLYGICYMKYTNKYSHNKKVRDFDVINPKYIRPIYKNGKITEYKMLTKKHGEEVIPGNYVSCITSPSIIENNIFFLDWIYPQVTKKESRPTLIYDKWEKYEKDTEKYINNPQKLKIIFQNSLKDCEKLKTNNYQKAKFLMGLGYAYCINNEIDEGIKYYEKAQKITENGHSIDMKELDTELTNFIIIGYQKLIDNENNKNLPMKNYNYLIKNNRKTHKKFF
jgi:hypothetical protein